MDFREYLNSKNYFDKINNSIKSVKHHITDRLDNGYNHDGDDYDRDYNINDRDYDSVDNDDDDDYENDYNHDDTIVEADDPQDLDNLTDTEDIDSDLDAAQKEAGDPEELAKDVKNTEDTEEVEGDEETTDSEGAEEVEQTSKEKSIETRTFNSMMRSPFFKSIKKACRSFKKISMDKDNGFEIPEDKKSINMGQMKLISCGYQIPTELFNQEPVNGKVANLDKIHMVDSVSVANTSSQYYGVSFFLRGDFIITDTNTDNYAEKAFNDIAMELKNTNKLTYDCFKAAIYSKIKSGQSINDDVIIGYMKVYNFAQYVSKIIDDSSENKKIPVIVSDRENLFFDKVLS